MLVVTTLLSVLRFDMSEVYIYCDELYSYVLTQNGYIYFSRLRIVFFGLCSIAGQDKAKYRSLSSIEFVCSEAFI